MKVLRPDRAPAPLMDLAQRADALKAAGADRLEWLRAERALFDLTPRQFVERVVERHRPVVWLEGPDFRFGHQRAGDVETLRDLGRDLGFEVRVIEPVQVTLRDKTLCTVRSSLVRWLVSMGRMADAALCLGRPFAVRGQVVAGERRGRQIGFPTANIDTADRQLPADGVYAGSVTIDGRPRLAAISVGTKPTFEGVERAFEVYVLDFDGDLYAQPLEVAVVRWLRDQLPFPSVEVLMEQMHRDVQQVRRLGAAGLLSAAATVAA